MLWGNYRSEILGRTGDSRMHMQRLSILGIPDSTRTLLTVGQAPTCVTSMILNKPVPNSDPDLDALGWSTASRR
jgi:hypothetical protein